MVEGSNALSRPVIDCEMTSESNDSDNNELNLISQLDCFLRENALFVGC